MSEAKIKKLASKDVATLTDAEWAARGDAWSLMTAEQVKADPKRYTEAKAWAAVMAAQGEDEVETFQKVANA